jgi:hypothetical protein
MLGLIKIKRILHRESFRRYITMDETRLERRKGQLASVLQDARGIIFIDYLGKGQTINSEYYIALLERLNDEIKKTRPHLKKKKVLFIKTMYRVKTNQNDGEIA